MVNSEHLYDTVIKKSLNLDKVPKVNGDYNLKNESYSIIVSGSDMDNFKRIFELSPPVNGETEGTNQGSGKGEIALYWLFSHQNSPLLVEDARGGSDPDLKLNNIGCEVKSYKNHSAKITLGKFSSDKENLKLLNFVFGFHFVSNKIEIANISNKEMTLSNFSPSDLLEAFRSMFLFLTTSNVDETESVQKQMLENIKILLDVLDHPLTPQEATHRMLIRLLRNKLIIKPGDKSFISNVKKDGDIYMFYIDFNKLDHITTKSLIDNVSIVSSEIKVNFKNIFG